MCIDQISINNRARLVPTVREKKQDDNRLVNGMIIELADRCHSDRFNLPELTIFSSNQHNAKSMMIYGSIYN